MFDIKNVINRTLIYFPVFKLLINNITFVERSDIKTAYTNGNTIYYNSKFFESLSKDQQVFILAHELMHITLQHLSRLKDRDMELWNYVTDAVINQILKKNGLPIIEGVIDCPDALSYSAEEYYEIMKAKPDLEEILSRYREQQKERIISTHEYWDQELSDDLSDNLPNLDEHNITEVNKKLIHDENEEYKEQLESGEMESKQNTIDATGSQTPIIDWKTFLQRKKRKISSADYNLFKGEFDEEGIYQYPYEVIRKANIEILIDTSGSVDDDLVKAFLKECKNIFDDFEIKIGCFDTRFYGFHTIKDKEELDHFEIEGRGLTDFSVAVQSFSRRASLKIVFTDGYDEVPKNCNDVIWIVYGNTNFKPPSGMVFYVDPNSLKLTGRTKR